MEYDIHNTTLEVVAVASTEFTANAAQVGPIIDTEGFDALEFILHASVYNNGTFTVTLEDGDDPALVDAAAVSAELVLGSAVLTGNGVSRIGTISKKRFVRATITGSGITTGTTLCGLVGAFQHARYNPTAGA